MLEVASRLRESERPLMNADEIVQTAAMELGFMPGRGLDRMPQRAREYVAAWLSTVDYGCGHDTRDGIAFTMMPIRSTLCAPCAVRAGLWRRAMRCGVCGADVTDVDEAGGGFACVFATEGHIIVFVALCPEHADERRTT